MVRQLLRCSWLLMLMWLPFVHFAPDLRSSQWQDEVQWNRLHIDHEHYVIRAFASGCQESLSSKPSRSVSDSAHNLDRAATESFRRRLQQLAIGRALDIDREREESVVIIMVHCHCSLSRCCCCPAGRAADFIFLLQQHKDLDQEKNFLCLCFWL